MSTSPDEASDEILEAGQTRQREAHRLDLASPLNAERRAATWRQIEAAAAIRREEILKQLCAEYLLDADARGGQSEILREMRMLSRRLIDVSRRMPGLPGGDWHQHWWSPAPPPPPTSRTPRLGRLDPGTAMRRSGPQHTWAAYSTDPAPRNWHPQALEPHTPKTQDAAADGTISLAALGGYIGADSLSFPFEEKLLFLDVTTASAGYTIEAGDLNAIIKRSTEAYAWCSLDMPIGSTGFPPHLALPFWGRVLIGSDGDAVRLGGGIVAVIGFCSLYISGGNQSLTTLGAQQFLHVTAQGWADLDTPAFIDQLYVPHVELSRWFTIDPAWLNVSSPTYATLALSVDITCLRVHQPDVQDAEGHWGPSPYFGTEFAGFDFRPSGTAPLVPPGTGWFSNVSDQDQPAPIKANGLALTVWG